MNDSVTFDASAALATAVAHHRAGQFDQAAVLYGRVLGADPTHFDALNNLGLLMRGGGRLREAVDLLQRAVTAAPHRAEGYTNLGNALRDADRTTEALDAHRRALAIDPEDPEAHNNLGVTCKALGRLEEAADAYRKALAIRPSFAAAQGNLGNAMRVLGHSGNAVAALRRAIELDPAAVDARMNLARALLEAGQAEDALDECDRLLGRHPYHVDTLSLKEVCLSETGRRDERRALADFDQHVRCGCIEPPAGFDSIDAFNAALIEYVLGHPTLEHNPPNHATINGWHSGDLLDGNHPCSNALETVIRQAVAAHKADMPADPAHPVTANCPLGFSLRVWAIVLETQGHQLPHVHPSGWLSGVYYVAVPDIVADPDAENGGWIEFGRAATGSYCRSKLSLQLVRPEPGLIVTFPSYVPHRTIPFTSEQKRISIAFDVVLEK